MYKHLIEALKQKNISIAAAAAVINMPESTFRTKLFCKRECGFTVDEAMAIKINLFPEMDFMYLFERTEKECA